MADNRDSPVRGALQTLAFLALAVGMPAICCHRLDKPAPVELAGTGDQDFDPASQMGTLKRNKPDWVLIGNSMLNSRFDKMEELSEISGWDARKVAKGGSQSSLWYLFLKNIVLRSGARPALVTIFFRSTDLTWADFRVEGLNERFIEALHGPEEPVWQQVILKNNEVAASRTGRIRAWLEALFPSKDLCVNSRRWMQTRAFRATRMGDMGANDDASERRVEMNDRFGPGHLRHDLGEDHAPSAKQVAAVFNAEGKSIDSGMYDDGPVVFDGSPDASFLPHLIALAKERGIQLHFHRIKQRPEGGVPRPESVAMQTYMKELRTYIEAQGCDYTDESQDASLTLDMYADGDHIAEEKTVQERYLKNFWERVKPIVKRIRETRSVSSN